MYKNEDIIKETKHLIAGRKNIIKKYSYKKIFKKDINSRNTKHRIKNIIKKQISKQKLSYKKRSYFYSVSFVGFIFIIVFIIYKNIFRRTKTEIEDYKAIFNKTIEKEYNEEHKEIQNYMNIIINGTVIDKNKIYYPSNHPKISIVISAYNGEAFLKTAILSVQNQDLKDIEIVIVDDGSKDNTTNLIKEMMKTEPRIVLYENEENKGALYTKSKGILLSKGKYVMTLDEDDIYVQRDAFSSLYAEAEKNNLDILVFIYTYSGARLRNLSSLYYSNKKRIIFQPELSNIVYPFNSKKIEKKFRGTLANIFYKTSLLQKAIKLIDEKNMNTKMICHEDFILIFLSTRIASNLKYINRIFYIVPYIWKQNDPKVKFRNKIKEQNKKTMRCFSYINFFEILFKNTKNTTEDKKLPFLK